MSKEQELFSKSETSTSLIDIFKQNKQNTLQSVNVATLGFYTGTLKEYDEDKKYSVIEVIPFPLINGQTNYKIEGYYLYNKETTFEENEIVLVIFTDTDFRQSLNSMTKVQRVDQNSNIHSKSFGIVIKLKK